MQEELPAVTFTAWELIWLEWKGVKKRQTHTEILRQVFGSVFIIHSKQEESGLPDLRRGSL